MDYVLVPVGGAGLLAGIAVAVKKISPKTKVIGVESESSRALSVSAFVWICDHS